MLEALDFGAEGIGLCRTEHMFFDADRIITMRQMIMANDTEGREAALAKLLPMQRKDFEAHLALWQDGPLPYAYLIHPHEFPPHSADELAEVVNVSGVTVETARQRGQIVRVANARASCRLSPIRKFAGCRRGPFLRRLVQLPRKQVTCHRQKLWYCWLQQPAKLAFVNRK